MPKRPTQRGPARCGRDGAHLWVLQLRRALPGAAATGALAICLGFLLPASPASAAQHSERFLVGFESAPGTVERDLVRSRGARVRYAFPAVRALAVAGPPARVRGLEGERRVRYVERDVRREPLGLSDAELEPSTSNGLYGLLTTRSTHAHQWGVTGSGAKVCVADTGIDADHPDIAPNYRGGIDTVDGDGDPDVGDSATETHGTHVAGTAAAALATQGVRGVAYRADLYHARVLDEEGGFGSDVMAGVRHLVEERGCKVVNLSLGGKSGSETEENFYGEMHQKGALSVAAAGNDGESNLHYPARYEVVLSVGAVDATSAHAPFSNTGENLDLSAPGVLVLSAVPEGAGNEASVASGGSDFRAFGLEHAGSTSGTTATLIDSGSGNTAADFPPGVAGNIALMQRGGATFATKVQNAMDAGAVAAIVYNNQSGDFIGTLGSETASGGKPWIPAVSVSDSAGADLKQRSGSQGTVVDQISSWDHYDGTSMATPHVSGVAALVLSADSSLTNDAVEQRLKDTAVDLGTAGYDTTFGHGLVNADAHAGPAAETPSDDTDGDGVPDDADSCPLLPATTSNGCPNVSRSLTLRYAKSAGAFRGGLSADVAACVRKQTVTVRRKRVDRPDKLIGRDATNRKGRYHVAAKRRPGKYYAKVPRKTISHVGNCSKAVSATLELD